jgi:F-type H+-transporting ATPase subunit delta
MRNQEISLRYARALFELAKENKKVEPVLNQLRAVNDSIKNNSEISDFFTGPTTPKETQQKILSELFKVKNLDEEVRGLLTILVEKRRFEFLTDIVTQFQTAVDDSQGIVRGDVRSASILLPEERQDLEKTISKYTGKKVVLEYHENKDLVGGLVAKEIQLRWKFVRKKSVAS